MKKPKYHFCVPLAITLPIIFGGCMLGSLYTAVFCYLSGSSDACPIFIFLSALSLVMVLILLPHCMRRVAIMSDCIICKGVFPGDCFTMYYDRCQIGMDYHKQDGRRIWWIYICEGILPKYSTNNSANRINSVPISPGFIRIMYSDIVFSELLEALPKNQKTALITACRCAGLRK